MEMYTPLLVKNINHFGLEWKKATITVNSGVITSIGNNRDQIGFDKAITIINFNVTFRKNPDNQWNVYNQCPRNI